MQNPHYVFDDAETALAAEAFITIAGGQAKVGRNAATGEPAFTKAQTTRWAVPVQRLDGKWVFPLVTPEMIAALPDGVAQEFATKFGPLHPDGAKYVVEEFQDDWFAIEELV